MVAKASKRLVIDASVARASGGEAATYPVSVYCRQFLQVVLKICHRMVMSQEIAAEWDRHQSSFARKWRVAMVARKKICRIDPDTDVSLTDSIETMDAPQADRDALLKDVHLVAAAPETDDTVVALDEAARRLFSQLAGDRTALRDVVWVNPGRLEEEPVAWLEKGARPEKERRLGASAKRSTGLRRETS